MNFFRCIRREIDRLYQDTMSLIDRARKGELPTTRVDPDEELGPCVHCGKQVKRTEGAKVSDDTQVHLICRQADNREFLRILAGYRALGEVTGPLNRLEDMSVTSAVKAGVALLPQRAASEDFLNALRRMQVLVRANRRISPETRAAAEAIIERGLASLRTMEVTGN